MGYATFVDCYDDMFDRWFKTFNGDLTGSQARGSVRFAKLQNLLGQLAQQLDVNGTYRAQWEPLMAGGRLSH